MSRIAIVVTVSDRSARGERADASGPVAVDALRAAGWTATGVVVADGPEPVGAAIEAALSELAGLSADEVIDRRAQKYLAIGRAL